MNAGTERRQPYPGLRPFRRGETDLFFGREDCVNALVNVLATRHFLAVLGPSGSGKSSLIRTGLLDALELGLMTQAGSRWRVVDFRPGGQPILNLASALLKSEGNASPQDATLLRSFLSRGPRSVIEWCGDGHLAPRESLLLLVDQFEELFRYQEYEGREEAEAFVALLLESCRSPDRPIYVTMTMRSEFLGACALIENLAERMNDGQYLTPRMTREQCRAAIEGPAAVCGVEIEPALVNRLLNDLADFAPWEKVDGGESFNQLDRLAQRADQLPLLQHALNRIWVRAVEDANGSNPGHHAGDGIVLRLDDYEAIGGIQGALDRHADDILGTLDSDSRPLAERVFRALTAGSTVADAIRRPTRFKELAGVCSGNEAGARAVVDAFRAPGRNFLLPESDVPIGPDTTIDISHESLIRQWRQLSAWLETEAQDAQQWRRLADAAALEHRRQGGLLQGLNLATLLEWRNRSQPSPAWARRYGELGEYQEVVGFLERSREAALRQRRRFRLRVGAALVSCVVIAGGVGYSFQDLQQEAERKLRSIREETAELLAGKRREAENKIKDDIQRTLAIRNPTVVDVRPIFDNAISLLRSVPQREAFDYDKARQKIIDLFEEVYTHSLIGVPLDGRKPFYIFDVIGQYLTDDAMWGYIVATLGSMGVAYVEAQKTDVAMLAFQQMLESARKKDYTLLRFNGELTRIRSNALGIYSLDWQIEIKLIDFFLDVLRILDGSDPETASKEAIAQLLERKGDTLDEHEQKTDARAAYRLAVATYRAIRAKSESKEEWDSKIQDLNEKISKLPSGKGERRRPKKRKH
jgi:hypothetical protein